MVGGGRGEVGGGASSAVTEGSREARMRTGRGGRTRGAGGARGAAVCSGQCRGGRGRRERARTRATGDGGE
eukprot:4138738-Prymnesium_polylepis.1